MSGRDVLIVILGAVIGIGLFALVLILEDRIREGRRNRWR